MRAHLIRQVREPIDVRIRVNSRVRLWALKNAWTLILMSALFIVTWISEVIFKYA